MNSPSVYYDSYIQIQLLDLVYGNRRFSRCLAVFQKNWAFSAFSPPNVCGRCRFNRTIVCHSYITYKNGLINISMNEPIYIFQNTLEFLTIMSSK